MIYLRVRKIEIDVIPNDEPFIAIHSEKVITDDSDNVVQVIGQFDRMYKRMSDVPDYHINDLADDEVIDVQEFYLLLQTTSYIWLQEKHGGDIIDGRLVLDSRPGQGQGQGQG